jgi:hypothetical protein
MLNYNFNTKKVFWLKRKIWTLLMFSSAFDFPQKQYFSVIKSGGIKKTWYKILTVSFQNFLVTNRQPLILMYILRYSDCIFIVQYFLIEQNLKSWSLSKAKCFFADGVWSWKKLQRQRTTRQKKIFFPLFPDIRRLVMPTWSVVKRGILSHTHSWDRAVKKQTRNQFNKPLL